MASKTYADRRKLREQGTLRQRIALQKERRESHKVAEREKHPAG